jgi:hypothetical protein
LLAVDARSGELIRISHLKGSISMAVRRVSAALAVALLIIASIAGCGKDSEGGTTTSNGAPTRLRMAAELGGERTVRWIHDG